MVSLDSEEAGGAGGVSVGVLSSEAAGGAGEVSGVAGFSDAFGGTAFAALSVEEEEVAGGAVDVSELVLSLLAQALSSPEDSALLASSLEDSSLEDSSLEDSSLLDSEIFGTSSLVSLLSVEGVRSLISSAFLQPTKEDKVKPRIRRPMIILFIVLFPFVLTIWQL